jgi:hypothetical protein
LSDDQPTEVEVPAVECDAGSGEVAGILQGYAEFFVRHGGSFNPSMRVTERAGALSVHWQGETPREDEDLLWVPVTLGIPVDGIQWHASHTTLAIEDPGPGLSPLHLEALDWELQLLNACDKLQGTARSHPQVTLAADDRATAAIRLLRPRFLEQTRSASEVLIGTRVYGFPTDLLHVGEPPADGADVIERDLRHRYLLPFAELLNHHPGAGRLRRRPGAVAQRPRVVTTTNECFARYQRAADPLDLALHYGYNDTHVRFVHSGAVDVDVSGIGRVAVTGARQQNEARLEVPRMSIDEQGITLSHVLFDADHPDRFTGILQMAVRRSLAMNGHDGDRAPMLTLEAVNAVAHANTSLARTAIDRLRSSGVSPDASRVVIGALERQVELLGEFRAVASGRPASQ